MKKSIGKEFMEMTNPRNLSISDQDRGVIQPPLELKCIEGKNIIELPDPQSIDIGDISVKDAIEKRESVREYSDEYLSLEELTFLLWTTQGVKETIPKVATIRNVPSAGARHAIETYILVNRVEGLNSGLYRYCATKNSLEEEDMSKDILYRIVSGCSSEVVAESAVTFIWTAIIYRMNWRYGERGYRYIHLDAGHVCQNLYLSCEAIGCGTCALGAFADDLLNKALNIDGKEQFTLYLATVGKKI